MNPETYEFEAVDEDTPDEWPRFKINEVVSVNGVEMRVRKITKKDIILRPVFGRPIGEQNDADEQLAVLREKRQLLREKERK